MSPPLSLLELAVALGGEVSGRQVIAPGPNHSARDRSLSVTLSAAAPRSFLVHSHAGDDFATCRDFVTQKLGLSLDAWRTRGRDGARQPTPTFSVPEGSSKPDHDQRIARAAALWNEAGDAHGTIVERYLTSRGLSLPDGLNIIRSHSRCPWRDEALGETIFVPAMIAAMRSIETDAITAVHRTRLTEAATKVDRRMLGIAAGAAIKIDADDAVTQGLAIGEGIETVLAARQLGFRPAWALASAGAIAAFPVLGGIEAITFLAENDEASDRAIAEASRRWHRAEREVTVIDPSSGDLNDAARAVR